MRNIKNIYNHLKSKRTFDKIYKRKGFKGGVSVSGPGSDLEQTKVLRSEIPNLLRDLKVKVLLDIPCGDFYWMEKVDLKGFNYLGGDIVKEIIELNKRKYSREDRSFLQVDLLNDKLSKADVLLCRDCLVHFSYRDIFRAINNIKRSPVKYLLTTTFTDRKKNFDIQMGQWRPLNLNLPPFNFPKPIKLINEKCTENNGIYKDKTLGLWKVETIPTFKY